MRKINWLVVHTAATRPSMDIGVKEIRQWHKQRGWNDIGYHYVIRRDGKLEKGRSDARVGAHVRGYNRDSLGISLVGGISERTLKPENNYTPAQWKTLETLLRRLSKKHPEASVRGHRDFPNVAKACPCFDAEPWARSKGFKTVGHRKQHVAELKNSRTVAGQSMAVAGTAGLGVGEQLKDTANEISMIAYMSEYLNLIFVGLTLAGVGLTLWAKYTDAKSNPKFDGEYSGSDAD